MLGLELKTCIEETAAIPQTWVKRLLEKLCRSREERGWPKAKEQEEPPER